MAKEYETQVLDIDVEEIISKLRKIKAKEHDEVMQKRYVFDIKCLNAIKANTGEWVRLRQDNQKTTLTYKNKTGKGLDQTEEIEVEVNDFDKTAELLSKIHGFTGIYYQENKRKKFELNRIEFTIDTWPMIPPYLEIEAQTIEGVKQGLKLLSLEGKDLGHIGSLDIYKRYGIDLNQIKELKFTK